MRNLKQWTLFLLGTCALLTAGDRLSADEAECPVISAGAGTQVPTGSVLNFGQMVIGPASSAAGAMYAGAMFCLRDNGVGVPAATVTSAVSRHANASGPGGFCDLTLLPPRRSEPRTARIAQVRIGFDVPPGEPSGSGVTLEQATCAAPAFVPYAGASAVAGSVAGSVLVLTFTPALENARTYRLRIGLDVTSVGGQTVEVRGLVGDANSSGRVNADDRSAVVAAWTSVTHFSCETDFNSSSRTNADDRSTVVAAWTGVGTNCAP